FFFFFFFFFFLTRYTLSLRVGCSGAITTCWSLDLLGSDELPTSVYQIAGSTGTHHHSQLIFVLFIDTGSHLLPGWSQTLELKRFSPFASQNAGITGVSHCAWPCKVLCTQKLYSPLD
uniref:Secreted protein n=1 Tax=Macaca mulatta TaxID=9544 RepID=A0A5F7ZL00_MACMU